MKKSILIAYGLLAAMTTAYCVAIWYAVNIWSLFFSDSGSGLIPLFWLGLAPLPLPGFWLAAFHWQLLAVFSLALSVLWGRRRSTEIEGESAYVLPIVVHISWMFLALLIHVVASLAPMLSIGSMIG